MFLPEFGTNTPPEAPPGVATSLDLLPEIEGDEYQLIAQVLSASFLGFGTQGPIAIAQVARGTTMRWDAGSLIHTVRSPAGTEFVLFSLSEIHTPIFDPFVLNGLAAMSLPPSWAYESEVLAADFTIGTPTGIASVYSGAELLGMAGGHPGLGALDRGPARPRARRIGFRAAALLVRSHCQRAPFSPPRGTPAWQSLMPILQQTMELETTPRLGFDWGA